MGKNKNLSTTFCYIRSMSFGRLGVHRIGAFAFAPVSDSNKVRVAWSLCNANDTFNPTVARESAIGRLNSDRTSVVVDRNSNSVVMDSRILDGLKVARAGTMERFELENGINGALFDLALSNQTAGAAFA